MLKMGSKLLVTFIFLFSFAANAFPLFYKCASGDRLDDAFAGPEIIEQVEAMLASARNDEEYNQKAMALCMGAKQCLEELEKIKSLINDSRSVMANILNVKTRLDLESREARVDDEHFQDIKKMVDDAYTIRACHEVKKTWSTDLWTGEDGDSFAVFYPKYSNYMYASGCFGRSSGAQCPGNKISHYKDKIKSALLMGMDPYLAIALVWMEGGTAEGLDYLYLDPIGKFASLGCTGEARSASERTDTTLDSFGTYYDIKPGVINNAPLARKLNDFQKAKGVNVQSGESYFCRKINDDLGLIEDSPTDGSCCLKLPFKKDSVDVEYIEEALVFEQARKNYQRRFRSNEDPAFRVQRFNGYSRLMGAAEPVEAFRAGVNHYENPAYGYQAMDYMISSILPNPVIQEMVANAEKEVEESLGRKSEWRSIMCVEHPGGGSFQIDSEYYFNKHRDTARLTAAFDRWKKGEELTGAEQAILDLEINTLVGRGIMSNDELNVSYTEIYNNYFNNYYPSRNTVGSASANQSTYDWQNLSHQALRNIGINTIGR